MLFSIIIPTIGRKEELERCLASINSNSVKYEIIIIDQNPIEYGICKICEKFPNTHYYHSNIKGLSKNRNFALTLAKGKWVLFSDDDCVFGSGLLDSIKLKILENGYINCICFIDVKNIEDDKYYSLPLNQNDKSLSYNNYYKIPSIGFIFSDYSLKALNGFDENFGVGSTFGSAEDTDIILRAFVKKILVHRLDNCSIYHPKLKKGTNLTRANNYAKGYGALFAKHLFLHSFSNGLKLQFKWHNLLIRNLIAIILFLYKPTLCFYYISVFRSKIVGFYSYLVFVKNNAAK